jgi:hypothetical protein
LQFSRLRPIHFDPIGSPAAASDILLTGLSGTIGHFHTRHAFVAATLKERGVNAPVDHALIAIFIIAFGAARPDQASCICLGLDVPVPDFVPEISNAHNVPVMKGRDPIPREAKAEGDMEPRVRR